MENNNKKIQVHDQWSEKYLREQPFMAFGSLCNLIGQAYQGKELTDEKIEELARMAFNLALEFTEISYNKVEKVEKVEDSEPDIKVVKE